MLQSSDNLTCNEYHQSVDYLVNSTFAIVYKHWHKLVNSIFAIVYKHWHKFITQAVELWNRWLLCSYKSREHLFIVCAHVSSIWQCGWSMSFIRECLVIVGIQYRMCCFQWMPFECPQSKLNKQWDIFWTQRECLHLSSYYNNSSQSVSFNQNIITCNNCLSS